MFYSFPSCPSSCLSACRASLSQPPARKIQKVDSDKPKKPKYSKHQATSSLVDARVGKEPGKQDPTLLKAKGDAPDRFWASVEPYCADITEADVRMLQEGIRSVSEASGGGGGGWCGGQLLDPSQCWSLQRRFYSLLLPPFLPPLYSSMRRKRSCSESPHWVSTTPDTGPQRTFRRNRGSRSN